MFKIFSLNEYIQAFPVEDPKEAKRQPPKRDPKKEKEEPAKEEDSAEIKAMKELGKEAKALKDKSEPYSAELLTKGLLAKFNILYPKATRDKLMKEILGSKVKFEEAAKEKERLQAEELKRKKKEAKKEKDPKEKDPKEKDPKEKAKENPKDPKSKDKEKEKGKEKEKSKEKESPKEKEVNKVPEMPPPTEPLIGPPPQTAEELLNALMRNTQFYFTKGFIIVNFPQSIEQVDLFWRICDVIFRQKF